MRRRLSFGTHFYPVAFVIGGFLFVSYTLCLAADAIFPGLTMYRAWEPWLPGVTGLSIGSWFLGVAELVLYAIYASALVIWLTWLVPTAEESRPLVPEPRPK